MRKICLIASFLFGSVIPLLAQSNYFEYLTTKDGLSGHSINGFYEDEYGRMWVATHNGLNCYNGQRFLGWGLEEGLQDTYIRRIAGNQSGYLLLQSRARAFIMDFTSERLSMLPVLQVSNIAGNAHGLWLVARDSLYRIQTTPAVDLIPVLTAPGITAIAPIDSQTVYVASDHGVELYRNGHATGISHSDIHQVSQLMVDSRKNLWACTRDDGLYLISPQHQITHFTAQTDNPHSLTDNDVRCITEDASGNYWIGLYGGLCHLDLQAGEIRRYEYDPRAEHALSTFSVWALATDKQGTVWIGTYFGGIDLINPQYSIYIFYGAFGKEGHHLSNPIVTGSCMDDKGNLWVGTNGGGLNYVNQATKQIDYIRLDGQEPQCAVKSLWIDDSRHRLWIATHRGGLKYLDTRTLQLHNYPFPERNLRKLLACNDSLFVLSERTIHWIDLATSQYHLLVPENVMPAFNSALSDMALVDGQLYFAHGNNLYSCSLTSRQLQCCSLDASITTLCADAHRLLIGTSTRGVWQYTDSGFVEMTAINRKLNSMYIMSIVRQGNDMAVTTNTGAHTFSGDGQLYTSHTTADGFPLEAMVEHSAAIYGDEVLAGGVNGMVLFPLHTTASKVSPVSLQLTGMTIDNEIPQLNAALPAVQAVELQPYNHNLTIKAATTGFITRRSSQLRYRLHNYDHDWITSDNAATISYTNLPKGRYTLEIECVGTDLHRELSIHVLPHWYDSWWAWTIYLLLGVAALVAALIRFERYVERKTRLQLNERYQQELQRATTIVLNHLADGDFNVQQFAKEMYVSRTGLYTKLQEIAGQTPNDFVLSIRMREAATLLRTESEMSILEVSERVGFNSSSYFIKCFHRFYGKSPSAWRKI